MNFNEFHSKNNTLLINFMNERLKQIVQTFRGIIIIVNDGWIKNTLFEAQSKTRFN